MEAPRIILAGATGQLGGRMTRALQERGAQVRALIRPGGAPGTLERLRKRGVDVVPVDFHDASALREACVGGACLVSAMAGLRDVIVEGQTRLLHAAVQAGVPRFIPSDFSMDFTRLPAGTNRSLDLRREFQARLDTAPIAATSVLNGAFTEMLTSRLPIILFRLKRVLYWGSADQLLDFTTMGDTAAFTAAAALDPSAPRFLRIAGDQVSARGLVETASEVTGERFRLVRVGGLAGLERLARVTRALLPGLTSLYSPWQGMQYLHDMFSGCAKLAPLDNDRYPGMRWTTVREVLAADLTQQRR